MPRWVGWYIAAGVSVIGVFVGIAIGQRAPSGCAHSPGWLSVVAVALALFFAFCAGAWLERNHPTIVDWLNERLPE